MISCTETMCTRYVVEVHADMRKAFGHVCRAELWTQGCAENCPLSILTSAICACA